MSVKFKLNGKSYRVEENLDKPLLWFLREDLKLVATKFGCGIGQCGACTVLLGKQAVRACSVTLAALNNAEITTLEGLDTNIGKAVINAWKSIDVPQCGYCQPGQIMAATALLANNALPSDDDIDTHMTNLCRCGTYTRIREAIHQVSDSLAYEVN